MTNSSTTVTQDEQGRLNAFAKEPQMQLVDTDQAKTAELLNGRLAMIGVVSALGAYITTGQLIPGIF